MKGKGLKVLSIHSKEPAAVSVCLWVRSRVSRSLTLARNCNSSDSASFAFVCRSALTFSNFT